MQKKLIGITLGCLASLPALAQSNVTVYGIVDANYSYSKSNDLRFSGINDGSQTGMSGSRLGFKGEEALGNGLKAVFTAEFGFNATTFDSKTGAFTNLRQSFVGLSNASLGSLTLGRQYAPSYSLLRKTAASGMQEVHATWAAIPEFTFINVGNGARVNNSVAYQSPNWQGFEVRAIYGFGEQVGTTADTSDAGRYGIGASYDKGNLFLTAVYQAIVRNDSILNDDGNTAWAVGGAYDFKFLKVFANYGTSCAAQSYLPDVKVGWQVFESGRLVVFAPGRPVQIRAVSASSRASSGFSHASRRSATATLQPSLAARSPPAWTNVSMCPSRWYDLVSARRNSPPHTVPSAP